MADRAAAAMPEDRRADLRRARRLAWVTLAYLVSTIALLAALLGSSQALKTAWYDDVLALLPPTLFLLGARVAARPATAEYPYGFGRAVSAAYLGASVALFGIGAYLLVDAAIKLLSGERPSIGGMSIFGHIVWQGWAAIPVLLWSSVPAILLGRAKLPLADRLNDKVLLADARAGEADWQTGAAAIIGILGVGAGFWWADSVAAALISLDILRDGFKSIRAAVSDLMDRRPQRLTELDLDPLPERLRAFLCRQDWVSDAAVRLREQGRLFVGEAYIVPRGEHDLVSRIERLTRDACALDWRLHELIISPTRQIPSNVARRQLGTW